MFARRLERSDHTLPPLWGLITDIDVCVCVCAWEILHWTGITIATTRVILHCCLTALDGLSGLPDGTLGTQ